MPPFYFNLAQMTKETFEYEGGPADIKSFAKTPNKPGLVYLLEINENTFCVKGFATDNIQKKLESIHRGNKDYDFDKIFPSREIISEISFFETNSFESAHTIKEQIVGRRFLLREDYMLNISDPGFQWWMKSDTCGFQVYFRCPPCTKEDKKLIRLGPVGDAKVASVRLNQFRTILQNFFPIKEFFCNDREFCIITEDPSHLNFTLFKNIFLRGEGDNLLDHHSQDPLEISLFHYFYQTAMIRKFWIRLEEQINQANLS
ncbi:MAG: hypothetical protein OXB84_05345 [Halobacteriovoraceae bacterium]|nr:hypothetical protein [Halobacteriovoraceae bacterium]